MLKVTECLRVDTTKHGILIIILSLFEPLDCDDETLHPVASRMGGDRLSSPLACASVYSDIGRELQLLNMRLQYESSYLPEPGFKLAGTHAIIYISASICVRFSLSIDINTEEPCGCSWGGGDHDCAKRPSSVRQLSDGAIQTALTENSYDPKFYESMRRRRC